MLLVAVKHKTGSSFKINQCVPCQMQRQTEINHGRANPLLKLSSLLKGNVETRYVYAQLTGKDNAFFCYN